MDKIAALEADLEKQLRDLTKQFSARAQTTNPAAIADLDRDIGYELLRIWRDFKNVYRGLTGGFLSHPAILDLIKKDETAYVAALHRFAIRLQELEQGLWPELRQLPKLYQRQSNNPGTIEKSEEEINKLHRSIHAKFQEYRNDFQTMIKTDPELLNLYGVGTDKSEHTIITITAGITAFLKAVEHTQAQHPTRPLAADNIHFVSVEEAVKHSLPARSKLYSPPGTETLKQLRNTLINNPGTYATNHYNFSSVELEYDGSIKHDIFTDDAKYARENIVDLQEYMETIEMLYHDTAKIEKYRQLLNPEVLRLWEKAYDECPKKVNGVQISKDATLIGELFGIADHARIWFTHTGSATEMRAYYKNHILPLFTFKVIYQDSETIMYAETGFSNVMKEIGLDPADILKSPVKNRTYVFYVWIEGANVEEKLSAIGENLCGIGIGTCFMPCDDPAYNHTYIKGLRQLMDALMNCPHVTAILLDTGDDTCMHAYKRLR